jgi:hypothetical protein
MLKTAFWKKAAASLPVQVRSRYIGQLEQAERWELALDGAIEVVARIKNTFGGRAPRGAH